MADYSSSDEDTHGAGVAPPPGDERRYVSLPAISRRRKRQRLTREEEEATADSVGYSRSSVVGNMTECNLCQVIGILEEPSRELQKLLRVGSVAWEGDRRDYLCIPEYTRFQHIAKFWNEQLLPELQGRMQFPNTGNFRQPIADASVLVQWTAQDVSRHFNNCTRRPEVKILTNMIDDFHDIYETVLAYDVFYCNDDGNDNASPKHDAKQLGTLLKISNHIAQMCTTRNRIETQKK